MPLLRKGAAVIFGALSFALLIPAAGALWDWLLIRSTDIYYIESDFIGLGLFFGIPGGLSLAVCLYVLFRRNAHGAWLLIPLGLLMLLAVAIPSTLHNPMSEARSNVVNRARAVQLALTMWGAEHGVFPATEDEFRSALGQRADSTGAAEDSPSHYARAGRRVPYRIVYVGGVRGPHLPAPPGDQPGIIYCAVSQDLRHAWLTATELDQAVGGSVTLLEFEPGLRWWEEKLPEPKPK